MTCLCIVNAGGEDCRYRVWDQFGRQLFSSGLDDYPVTAISWSVDGQLFAVGSFNTLRLCDKIGWSHSLDKPATGSIYKIAWSTDSTQIAAACGNGNVIFAHVIEKRIEWREFEATVTGKSRTMLVIICQYSLSMILTVDTHSRKENYLIAQRHQRFVGEARVS